MHVVVFQPGDHEAYGRWPEAIPRPRWDAYGGVVQLTTLEVEVLQLVAEGQANKQVAVLVGGYSHALRVRPHIWTGVIR